MSHLEDDDLLKTQTPGAAGLIAGRYQMVRPLGRGGMGEVLLVRDSISRVQFALKRIPEDVSRNSVETENLRESYELVQALNHVNIANYKALDYDGETGGLVLLMEYVEGLSLDRWIKKNGPMTEGQAVRLLSEMASALDYAHANKVLHRDIKPSNIQIQADGAAKLIDFGLAAQVQSSLTRVSIVDPARNFQGTRPYMAPELWRGRRAVNATDQWALAATVYEALSGDPPWMSDDQQILGQCILNEVPVRIEGINDALWVALERALAKDPGQRWANCGEFARAAEGQKKQPAPGVAPSKKPAESKAAKEARARAARETREQKEKEEVVRRQSELEEQIRQEQAKRRATEADAAAERKRREAERARAEAAERRRREEQAARSPSLIEKAWAKQEPKIHAGAIVVGIIFLGLCVGFVVLALSQGKSITTTEWLAMAFVFVLSVGAFFVSKDDGHKCSRCNKWFPAQTISKFNGTPKAPSRCPHCGVEFV